MIEQRLREEAGVHVAVRLERGRLTLEGLVQSPEASRAAVDLAAAMAVGYRIENDLEIIDVQPDESRTVRVGYVGSEPDGIRDWLGAVPETAGAAPHVNDADDASGESGRPFVPAMDPVLTLNTRGQAQILGGFALSALDDVSVEASAVDPALGDEAIADAVRRELREDAATTALPIEVEVWDRVAHLRGVVAGPEDVDAAEAVAARVPGVAEIADDLEVRVPFSREAGRDL
jgi:osmotically-inducible protein OsmY